LGSIIELGEWLDQPFFNEEITIRKFIRSVTDKLATHSDDEYNEILNKIRHGYINNAEVHEIYIASIGEYIFNLIEPYIRDNPFCEKEKQRIKGYYFGVRKKK
jgi:hypothetical protein